MESYNLDNITHDINFIKKCKILPKELTNKLNQHVLKNIKNSYENIIQKEGYIIPDTIKLIEIGDVYTSPINFDGGVMVNVVFSAKVIKPTRNSVIECTIKRINNFAISAIAGPLNLKIPFEDSKEDISQYKVDDIIKVRIINSLSSLHKNFYNIYGTLYHKKTRMLSEQSISSEKEIDLRAEETDNEDIELEEDDEEEDINNEKEEDDEEEKNDDGEKDI